MSLDALLKRHRRQTDGFHGLTATRCATLLKLYRKQRGVCHLCGGMMSLKLGLPTTATIEHVIPQSAAPGACMPKKAACWKCNNEKGAMSEAEYRQSRSRTATGGDRTG